MLTTPNYSLQQPQANDTVDLVTLETTNTNILDSALTPTADPTQAPAGLSGKLSQWVSWFTNRIKAITGTTNWYDAPPTTLTTANSHITNTSNPHNVTTAQIGAAPVASPGLTGTPTAPTATAGTNTTQIATTAFVLGQAGTATPLVDGVGAIGSSYYYARQDHIHPTDTSRQAALGYTPVNKAGDTMSGPLTVNSSISTSGPELSISSNGEARVHVYNGGGVAEWKFGQKSSTSHNFILSKTVSNTDSDYLTIDTSGNVTIAGNLSIGGTVPFSSASGTWTPASGTLNVPSLTAINVAAIPTGAKIFIESQISGYWTSGANIDSWGVTTPSGTAFLGILRGSSNYPFSAHTSGITGGVSGNTITVYDGTYYALGYFQINNGYLQFVTTGPGTAYSATGSTIWWGVA